MAWLSAVPAWASAALAAASACSTEDRVAQPAKSSGTPSASARNGFALCIGFSLQIWIDAIGGASHGVNKTDRVEGRNLVHPEQWRRGKFVPMELPG
jgi:hypothetical protein